MAWVRSPYGKSAAGQGGCDKEGENATCHPGEEEEATRGIATCGAKYAKFATHHGPSMHQPASARRTCRLAVAFSLKVCAPQSEIRISPPRVRCERARWRCAGAGDWGWGLGRAACGTTSTTPRSRSGLQVRFGTVLFVSLFVPAPRMSWRIGV
eukprot:2477270-Prymnesium_polylepis.1